MRFRQQAPSAPRDAWLRRFDSDRLTFVQLLALSCALDLALWLALCLAALAFARATL